MTADDCSLMHDTACISLCPQIGNVVTEASRLFTLVGRVHSACGELLLES